MGRSERILSTTASEPDSAHDGPFRPEDLYASPNALAPHYRRFGVADRLLLTGHSHQAWPDVAFAGQQAAWLDAAAHVDDKWDAAFAKAEAVRVGYRRLIGDPDGSLALGVNTHELVVRFLSALPLRDRPRLVTTDGEFHTIRRQLDRLAEEGLEVVKVAAEPTESLADRLAGCADDRTAAVLVSSILYKNARRVPGLSVVAEACHRVGAELLIDGYHHLNVVPLSLADEGLDGAFFVGGGYKYCQLGEGNCFLRIPRNCRLRPAITGWFSEFSVLGGPDVRGVPYGTGADRFAGSTYDPTSHYRAASVFEFFGEQGLTAPFLHEISQHQMGRLMELVDDQDLDPSRLTRDRSVDLEALGGFLALEAPRAEDISRELRSRGVYTDFRGSTLRLGPAPYLSDRQLADAVGLLADVVRAMSR